VVFFRCQKAHFKKHKTACKDYSTRFIHCACCDSTINTKTCHTCYQTTVCDRDKCVQEHKQNVTCVTPKDVEEIAVLIHTTEGTDGSLSIVCQDGVGVAPTMKNLVLMLIKLKTFSVLTDRTCLAYFTFGGVVKKLEPGFECTGPMLGVTLSHQDKSIPCADGMERTPISKLKITAGGGGPWFNVEDTVPLKEGMNLVKVAFVVIPLSCTTRVKEAGSSG
jgi:hypothetical protein